MSERTFIAPHLREAIFRSYEPLIARAVAQFPIETSFPVPHGIAPTTFVANFRNAILSLKLYAWETDIVTPDLREKLWKLGAEKSYAINQDTQGHVWFRHRQRAGRPNMMTAEAKAHYDPHALPEGVVPWRDPTEAELRAVTLLLHYKRISGPIPVVGPIDTKLSDELTSLLDISIIFESDKNLTIIN